MTPCDNLGPCEITGHLGKGGMSEVYRTTDTRLHRDVAIKVSAEHFGDRFEREARAVAAGAVDPISVSDVSTPSGGLGRAIPRPNRHRRTTRTEAGRSS